MTTSSKRTSANQKAEARQCLLLYYGQLLTPLMPELLEHCRQGTVLSFSTWQHSGSVISTVVLQRWSTGFNSHQGKHLQRVCMFFLCSCLFPPTFQKPANNRYSAISRSVPFLFSCLMFTSPDNCPKSTFWLIIGLRKERRVI